MPLVAIGNNTSDVTGPPNVCLCEGQHRTITVVQAAKRILSDVIHATSRCGSISSKIESELAHIVTRTAVRVISSPDSRGEQSPRWLRARARTLGCRNEGFMGRENPQQRSGGIRTCVVHAPHSIGRSSSSIVCSYTGKNKSQDDGDDRNNHANNELVQSAIPLVQLEKGLALHATRIGSVHADITAFRTRLTDLRRFIVQVSQIAHAIIASARPGGMASHAVIRARLASSMNERRDEDVTIGADVAFVRTVDIALFASRWALFARPVVHEFVAGVAIVANVVGGAGMAVGRT
mmetsp:Transcript_27544/g.58188  ORF Transcript_27544/g.58188 Transcript_27544/m.58188 type:complete len:293 (+) Transcript_27544:480-1358(+)